MFRSSTLKATTARREKIAKSAPFVRCTTCGSNAWSIALTLGLLVCSPAHANPTGAKPVQGKVAFSRPDAKTLNITNTPSAIINWQSFSIGKGETTRFIQQNAGSAVLNRVTGQVPSAIMGQLLSNGRVFLINRNGMVFGPNAVIDTAGFVASTLNMTDRDFLAGKLKFEGGPDDGAIRNRGLIQARADGGVYLIASSIENSGIVRTEAGNVLLAAGRKLTISSLDVDHISFEIQAPANDVVNLGKLLTSGGAMGVFAGTIRNHGTIEAQTAIADRQGNIKLVARGDAVIDASGRIAASGPRGGEIHVESETGSTLVSGSIEARGVQARGGDVRLLGERVGLLDSGRVDVSGEQGGGSVLVGGDYQGKGPARNARVTLVGRNASIRADAWHDGDGGKVVVWADGDTRYLGSITARGGTHGGNGGLVEVSGKENLQFDGAVNLTASKGRMGTLLLDPGDIIVKGQSEARDDGELFDAVDAVIGRDDGSDANFEISEGALEQTSSSANIILQARRDIKVEALRDGSLTFPSDQGSVGTIAFDAGRDFVMKAEDRIVGRGITITAGGSIALGGIDTDPVTVGDGDGSDGGVEVARSVTRLSAASGASGSITAVAGGALLVDGPLHTTGANIHLQGTDVRIGPVELNVGNANGAINVMSVGGQIAFQGSTLRTDNLRLDGSVAGAGPLAIIPISTNTIDIGSPSDPLLSSANVAALKTFSGSLSIGGTVGSPEGGSEARAGSMMVTGEFRTTGDLTLVSLGDISVAADGSVGAGGTLTLAALGQQSGTGSIRDTGQGDRFSLDAPTMVLLANNEAGTRENPLTVRSGEHTVMVGAGAGSAFLDGAPGTIEPSGSAVASVFQAFEASSIPLDPDILATTVNSVPVDLPSEPPELAPDTSATGVPSIFETYGAQEPAIDAAALWEGAIDTAARFDQWMQTGPIVERELSRTVVKTIVPKTFLLTLHFDTPEAGVVDIALNAILDGKQVLADYRINATRAGRQSATVLFDGSTFSQLSGPGSPPPPLPPTPSPARGTRSDELQLTGTNAEGKPMALSLASVSIDPDATKAEAYAAGARLIDPVLFGPPRVIRPQLGETTLYRFYSLRRFEKVKVSIARAEGSRQTMQIDENDVASGVAEDSWTESPWSGKDIAGRASLGPHLVEIRAYNRDKVQAIVASDPTVTVAK
jgi:filamentous hemagglutinin family protein